LDYEPQERIVVAAKDAFQNAVAALSQTCAHFYSFLGQSKEAITSISGVRFF